MYYSFRKNFFILLALITTNFTTLVITPPLSASDSRNSPVPNSSSQSNRKQTSTLLSTQNRLQRAKKLFEEGNQQYLQHKFSQAEKSLIDALRILNDGIQPLHFDAPRTRPKFISIFGKWKIRLPSELPTEFFGNTSIQAIRGFNVNVNTSLDELYVSLTNYLNQNANPDKVVNGISQANSISYNNQIAQKLLDCASRQKENCDDIYQIYNQATPNKQNQSQNIINEIENNIEDNQKVETKILRLLQKVLIAQNKQEKTDLALRFAQQSHNLELFRTVPAIVYALNKEVITNEKTTENDLSQLLSPKNLHVNDIKKIFYEEEATLVYYSIVSPEEIFVWVVQPNKNVHFRKLSLSSLKKPLEEAAKDALKSASAYVERGKEGKTSIQAVRNLRSSRTDININNIEDFTTTEVKQRQNLQQLYKDLILPIEELLPRNPDSHVVIVPQGHLLLVPFSVLQDASGNYLIEKHTIRIAPNLHNLTRKRSSLTKIPEPNEILIVGNPKNSDTPVLPGAEREAQSIGKLLSSPPLIGDQAQKKRVEQEILNKKIIHFATHGILDRRKNSSYDDTILLINSSNKFTTVNRIVGLVSNNQENHKLWYNISYDEQKKTAQHLIRTNGTLPGTIVLADDSLTSQEILNLKLNADLAVLSACNTGKGITRDSIVLGLPLSLGIAGVRRVIVSLWAVPDAPTELLMYKFYEVMKKQEEEGRKIDEAQALRKAMLGIKNNMKEYSDPIYWAGFTLIDVSYQTKESDLSTE